MSERSIGKKYVLGYYTRLLHYYTATKYMDVRTPMCDFYPDCGQAFRPVADFYLEGGLGVPSDIGQFLSGQC